MTQIFTIKSKMSKFLSTTQPTARKVKHSNQGLMLLQFYYFKKEKPGPTKK